MKKIPKIIESACQRSKPDLPLKAQVSKGLVRQTG